MGETAEHTAIFVSGYNHSDPAAACSLGAIKTPSPSPGEVLIRLLCRPIQPADILAIRGWYQGWRPTFFPIVPGFEAMGVVHQVGENVTDLKVGQRVVALRSKIEETGQGAWQEYVVAPAVLQFPIPDAVDDETASQFLINPWSVYGMVDELKVPKGDYVLQTAAGSVLGRMFIQYAHNLGIKTINLVRRNEQKEELKALGANEVINFTEEDVVQRVREITGEKMVFGAIECVGGELTKLVASCVRKSGTVLVYGVMGSYDIQVGIEDILFRDIKIHGFWLSTWFTKLAPSEIHKVAAEIWDLLERKVIQPLNGEQYPLEKFKEAINMSQESSRGGKVFLVSP